MGAALGVFVVLLVSGYAVDRTTRARLVERERAHVAQRLSPYANALGVAIQRRVSRLTSLDEFVRAARSVEQIDRQFTILASGLQQAAGGLRALQLVRHGVIRWVYPRSRNVGVLGQNLFADPRPGIARDVRRALADTGIVLTSPLALPGGTRVLVAHLAIRAGNTEFPDLASVMIELDTLFAVASLLHGIDGLDVAVLDGYGAIIGPTPAVRAKDAVEVTAAAPGGRWTIAAAPTGGWDAAVAGPLRALRSAWLIVTLLLATMAYLVVERQSRLSAAVRARTAELLKANINLEREVREREEAEAALRRREEQLLHAQKMEAMGTLAGGIAHDFNNILTAIIGFGGLALDRAREAESAAEPKRELAGLRGDIQEILRAAEHASLVTNQLLSFSRKQMTQAEFLDVAAVVRETEVLLRRLLGERIRLETRLGVGLPRVHADRSQLTQVLVNLAVNARDAMTEGGMLAIEAVAVVVTAESNRAARGVPEGRYVELVVSDTGPGMPPDVQSRIFEPFFTTKGLGKGTGLGLSTVYGIVLRLGGRVLVDSEVGRGTTFRVLLPEKGKVESAHAEPSGAVLKVAATESILLVEDEPGVRQLVSRVLSRLGFDVIAASSGEEALAVSQVHPGRIHLLVTDLVMPGISGRVTAERLKAERPGMRVLFISGYSDEATKLGELDGGRASLLAKPFTPEMLAKKVREVLDAT